MFNPNHTIAPDPSTYMNYTGCHLSEKARNAYYDLQKKGVLNTKGKYDEGAQVYYDWDDVNSRSHLVVYNGLVLFFLRTGIYVATITPLLWLL